MARPNKFGLDYFPMDVDTDDKFEMIEAKYDVVGFGVVVKLYQRIYKSGYFIEINNDNLFLIKKSVNIEISMLQDIINDCLKYGIFNFILYHKYSVLTSAGIQKRFLTACDRRKTLTLVKEYMLIDVTPFKGSINWVNVDNNYEPTINTTYVATNEIPIDELAESMKNDVLMCEIIAMQNIELRTIELVHFEIDEFVGVLKQRGEKSKSFNDARSHFTNWYLSKKSKIKPNGNKRRTIDTTTSHYSESL